MNTIEALEQCLDRTGQPAILFKHSTRCALSAMAKSRLENAPAESLNYFLIDVIQNREVSSRLSEIIEVRHESPQAILVRAGNVETVKSHMEIRPSAFAFQE